MKMMSEEEAKTVKLVYNRFMDGETEDWVKIDDVLDLLEMLSTEELIAESAVKYLEHSKGVLRCGDDHGQQYCMAPYVFEAVAAILSLYKETGSLHDKNAYILKYYLALSQLRVIYPA